MTNKTLLIHAATEAVIVSVISAVLFKKIASCNERIQQLSATVMKQQEQIHQCMKHIEMLSRAFEETMFPQERQERQMQERIERPRRSSPPTQQMMQQMMMQTQPQPQQMMQQSSSSGGPGDLIGSLMGFVPTIMQTMTSGNGASAIIATLDKEVQPAQEEVPKVDILSDEFENDINEALRAEDSKQVSIQDDTTTYS
jgi:hypothetical protein